MSSLRRIVEAGSQEHNFFINKLHGVPFEFILIPKEAAILQTEVGDIFYTKLVCRPTIISTPFVYN